MKTIILVAAAALLSGCASLDGKFENRLACTLAGDEVHMLSKYGPWSIGSRVSDKDLPAACKSAK